MNNSIELAKAAMGAAAIYYAEMEKQRFLHWKSLPARGRKPFEPIADIEGLCKCADDLYTTMVDAVRREAKGA